MTWLVGIAMVLAVVYLAVTRPRFGLTIGGLIGAFVLIAIGIFWYWDAEQKRETEQAKGRIPISQVELVDLRLASSRLTGRARNRSPRYTLSAVTLRIIVRDCVKDQCEIVAQDDRDLWLSVPPGQARDFDTVVSFGRLATPHGSLGWSYEIIGTRGN